MSLGRQRKEKRKGTTLSSIWRFKSFQGEQLNYQIVRLDLKPNSHMRTQNCYYNVVSREGQVDFGKKKKALNQWNVFYFILFWMVCYWQLALHILTKQQRTPKTHTFSEELRELFF